MADDSSSINSGTGKTPEGQGGENLAEQLARIFSNLQPQQQNQQLPQSVPISTKLGQNNYSLWARLMMMAIGGRGKLGHLTGIPAPPAQTNILEYQKWQQTDLTVCSWILENMEDELVSQYAEYPTAQELWEGLSATYSQGREGIQIFDLTVKANTMRRGADSIEQYYSNLKKIWREIATRQPNPMGCADDMAIFNRLRAETNLFQFLQGISDEFDTERRELLKEEPLPTPEAAYAYVRRERDRRLVMVSEKEGSPSSAAASGIGAGFGVH